MSNPALEHAMHIRELAQKHQKLVDSIRAEYREELNVRIGMLRQWLNEDRIKDAKRFVTNEDIELWLFSERKPQ